MDRLIEILEEIKPGVEYKAIPDLLEAKILDSLKIVQLVAELNDEFDIEITPIDVVPENFRNVDTILALVERLSEE